jgi:hypothetical protein
MPYRLCHGEPGYLIENNADIVLPPVADESWRQKYFPLIA